MKTNFIENLKQFLFLIIAVLGTFISYSQPLQNLSIEGSNLLITDKTDMGVSKSSEGDLLNNVNVKHIFVQGEDVGTAGIDAGTGQYDGNFDLYDLRDKNTPGDLGVLPTQNDIDYIGRLQLSGKNLEVLILEYMAGIGCSFDFESLFNF